MHSGRRSSVNVMGQNEELFVHKATVHPATRVTIEKILANLKEKIAIREEQIPEIEERAEQWVNFETTLQASDAHIERNVKRLLEHVAGDERVDLIDKMGKVTYDISMQMRDSKNIKEAEEKYTKDNKLTARTAEILKSMKVEDAKIGSALDAAAASLDKTHEKVYRQMDAVGSFAASVGIEKEFVTQLLAQASSSAGGGNIVQ